MKHLTATATVNIMEHEDVAECTVACNKLCSFHGLAELWSFYKQGHDTKNAHLEMQLHITAKSTAHLQSDLQTCPFMHRQAKRDYLRSAEELQNMLLMLHTRSRAATTIAAAWRGRRQRMKFLPIWQAYQLEKAATILQQVCL